MNNPEDDKYKKFQCKICLDLASEPVITPCGHLYCWQCLYKWAESKNPLKCPYCSNVFELDKVTTIFTGDSKEEKKSEIPKRPTNPRTEPSQQQQHQQQNGFGNFQFGFGFGGPFMAFSTLNFGQGFQGNNRFAIFFFLGCFIMNFVYPLLNSYIQDVPESRPSRAQRNQQNQNSDQMKDIILILAIFGIAESLIYFARKFVRNQN